MPAFEFEVRRPLPTKEGFLTIAQPDGRLERKMTELRWPILALGDDKVDYLEYSEVWARSEKDKALEGSQSFCLEIVSRKEGGASVSLYAQSAADRADWVKKLRKHAVHHDLENGFELTKKVLGMGSYATVYLARDKVKKENVALKIIQKTRLNAEERQLLAEEVRISQEVDSKYCIKTYEFVELVDSYVLVMEYVGGGELFERLLYHTYSEAEVQIITKQLLIGVAYLHARKICHRDLKPENFLLTTEIPMTLKIADYGISVDVDPARPDKCLKDGDNLRCSPGYGAPEIVRQETYGLPCDMWSIGVVVYLLLTGRQPFNGRTPEETRRLMIKGSYDSSPLAHRCSMIASDLIARLLDMDAAKRITAEQALEHPWIKDGVPNAKNGDAEENAPTSCCCGLLHRKPQPASFRDPSVRSMTINKPVGPIFSDASIRHTFFNSQDPSSNLYTPATPTPRGRISDDSPAGGLVRNSLERSDTCEMMMTAPQASMATRDAADVEMAFQKEMAFNT